MDGRGYDVRESGVGRRGSVAALMGIGGYDGLARREVVFHFLDRTMVSAVRVATRSVLCLAGCRCCFCCSLCDDGQHPQADDYCRS